MQACEKGNTSLLIFLGKQYLGQADKQDLNLDAGKIEIIVSEEDTKL